MNEIIEMVCEMAPYLLLGFFIAGLMHSFVPSSLFRSYLNGSSFRSVFYAALLGIPIPLCSCGVIPTALSLHKEGASKGASVSFLIATPQTGVDSIAATYSLMGLPFAILRPLVALITAILGGHMVNLFDRQPVNELSDDDEHAHSCGCSHDKPAEAASFSKKLVSALEYAFVDMMAEIGKWLVVGLVIAGLLTVFLPDDFLSIFSDQPILGMIFVLLLAIPMYVCATGSIPIAVALMLKGLSPGAALVLLMAGPAVNMASILVIRKALGRRTLLLYLLSIIGGSMLFGLAVDYLMPREWFSIADQTQLLECCHEGPSLLGIISAVVLVLLLLNVLRLHFTHPHECSCCHEHEHEEHHECCCHEHEHEEHHDCCCHEHEHEDEEHHDSCCHEHEHEEHHDCCCHKE